MTSNFQFKIQNGHQFSCLLYALQVAAHQNEARGEKRKTEEDHEPTHFDIFKRRTGPGSTIYDLTLDEDQLFSSLLVAVTSHSICPEMTMSRYRVNELSPRNYYIKRAPMSVLLSSLDSVQKIVDEHNLETRIRLCDRSSVGLTVYKSLPYISFQYNSGKNNNPFYFNVKREEFRALMDVLQKLRAERDDKLKPLKESLDDKRQTPSLHQATVHDVQYRHPYGDDIKSEVFFNLEEGIKGITDEGYSIVGSKRRKVEMPTLSAIALMLASILLRCKKDGLIETLDHVVLARYLEAYFSSISPNPYLSSELLTVSKFALESQRESLTLFLLQVPLSAPSYPMLIPKYHSTTCLMCHQDGLANSECLL